MNNQERAESVEALVAAFANAMGLEHEDPATQAGDMICNLLHWAQQNSELEDPRHEALHAARSGISHYVTETCIDYEAECVDELGPESLVTIVVQCDGTTWRTAPRNETIIE